MDEIKFNMANNEVNEVYSQLREAMNATVADLIKPIDDIVTKLSKGINLFSNAELWEFQLQLGIETYKLSNFKELSSLKDICAEALYKEGLARSYTLATGAAENKKQQAILETIDKQAVSMLYTSISSLLKTKCDEAHRLVNIIQNIQISRAAEAKLTASPRSEGDRVTLLE